MTDILGAVLGFGHGADGNSFDKIFLTFSFHSFEEIVV